MDVSAILPQGGNIFREKVPAAVFSGNTFEKMAGRVEKPNCIEARPVDKLLPLLKR